MERIFLCGIKHCGKSTLGKLLARFAKAEFRDTDAELEALYAAREGKSLSAREIFRSRGEEFFRRLEAEAVEAVLNLPPPLVAALGGGALENRFVDPARLKAAGKIVFLNVDENTAFRRVLRNGLPPFLADAPDPEAEFRARNAERRRRFSALADLRFDLGAETAPRTAAAKLFSAIKKEWKR